MRTTAPEPEMIGLTSPIVKVTIDLTTTTPPLVLHRHACSTARAVVGRLPHYQWIAPMTAASVAKSTSLKSSPDTLRLRTQNHMSRGPPAHVSLHVAAPPQSSLTDVQQQDVAAIEDSIQRRKCERVLETLNDPSMTVTRVLGALSVKRGYVKDTVNYLLKQAAAPPQRPLTDQQQQELAAIKDSIKQRKCERVLQTLNDPSITVTCVMEALAVNRGYVEDTTKYIVEQRKQGQEIELLGIKDSWIRSKVEETLKLLDEPRYTVQEIYAAVVAKKGSSSGAVSLLHLKRLGEGKW